jgi:hypothetical protein
MNWKPKAQILEDRAENEPTKTSETDSVVFVGATFAESPEIEAGPDPAELARASGVLNRAGVRIMALEGGATIGVWSDLDGPEVRAALRTFGSDRLPVRYLDGAGVPMRYKARGGRTRPHERACRNGTAPGGTLEGPGPDVERNGLVSEGNRVGGAEGGGAEPAVSGTRHVRATGQDHGGDCPPRRTETMKKPEIAKKNSTAVEVHGTLERLSQITGATTKSGQERILLQMASMAAWCRDMTKEQKVHAAAELIAELEPANLTQAFLAVQMFSVHEAALVFLQRATMEGQTFEGTDANVLRATRLMRLFNEQAEMLAILKGKTSQQKVTVEHVHVHQGGQAIVGAVSTAKPDRGEGDK